MAKKHCMVFETLGKVNDLNVVQESKNGDGLMRLSGVFGVVGIRNENHRIYEKKNYAAMVEHLQKVIQTEGCPGELEHPNSMNINLNNVSHKIESIRMNEDGTITGTIALLNTSKGKEAQAIVEGGLPLYISSRAAGTISEDGHVQLSMLKTYDLVGTPGFKEAKMSLAKNQTLECLNESLDDGNIMYAIIEDDEKDTESSKDDASSLLGDDSSNADNKEGDDNGSQEEKHNGKPEKKPEEKDTEKAEKTSEKEDPEKEEKEGSSEKEEDNKKDNSTDMDEIRDEIKKLSDQVKSLRADLHIAKESLNQIEPVDYEAIQEWVTEEFGSEFEKKITSKIASGVQKWVTEEFAPVMKDKISEGLTKKITEGLKDWSVKEFSPLIQKWITDEYSPEVQKWLIEEFAPEIQNWIVEEYSPELQNWIVEEYSPEIQNWITEEYSPVVDKWINEEVIPENNKKINESIDAYLKESKANRLENIDNLLESLESNQNSALNNIIKEEQEKSKYAGVYVVEHMPAEYSPSWNMISEEKKDEIIRMSRAYDFTKPGVLESFWNSVDFNENKEEPVNEAKDIQSDYHSAVYSQMMRLRAH